MVLIKPINPSTGEIYGELEETSDSEIRDKVLIAKEDKDWKNVSFEKRAEIISILVNLLAENKESLARVMACEIGKPVKAGKHEIELAGKRILDYCNLTPRFISDEVLFDVAAEKNVMVFEPLGTVAVISPWNAPIFVPLATIIPALLCGNNVIWKPSEYSIFSGLELNKLFDFLKNFGFPKNTFQIIIGAKDVGRKLVESEINMIALTGSVKAGQEIIRNSAEKMHRILLELGGKDPAIVLKDANIEATTKAIVNASTMYTGQVCFGVERVYCDSSIYEEFAARCVEESLKLIVGDPLDEYTDIGPFAVKFQFERVLEHIRDSLEKGASLLCGGEKIGFDGYFMRPGVIVNVNHKMKIMKEETFGPITPIMPFKDIEEAIKLANDSEYGLTASIWTSDLRKGEEIARRIEAGTVEVNRHGMSKAGCPWGGYKKSGIGRIYSKEGIRGFCNIKHVWIAK